MAFCGLIALTNPQAGLRAGSFGEGLPPRLLGRFPLLGRVRAFRHVGGRLDLEQTGKGLLLR